MRRVGTADVLKLLDGRIVAFQRPGSALEQRVLTPIETKDLGFEFGNFSS